MADAAPVVGVVLAGGLARRMAGGDKPLSLLGGRPVIEHVLERFAPQCAEIVLNANGDTTRFAGYGLPVVPDDIGDNPGPLAGILAGLEWVAGNRPGTDWMASVAADCPFLPGDLIARLAGARKAVDARIAVAASAGRTHPVIALWDVGLRDDLRRALVEEGVRKVDRWTARHARATATWPAEPVDPFFNVNTPGDLQEAERLAERLPDSP